MRYIIAIFCLLMLWGCNKDAPTEPRYTKVILCYFAADNSLSSEVSQKVEAVRQGVRNARETGSKVICYADVVSGSASLFEIAADGDIAIQTFSQENSASGQTLGRVIDYVRKHYTAEKYGMILFSHASGWLPAGALGDPVNFASAGRSRSVAMDGQDELELAEFAQAIPDHMFEYIVFEACYMAGIEVAYALRNKTDYIVASAAEIVSPGFEEVYPASLRLLLKKNTELRNFAANYFENWDNKSSYLRSATVSLISTGYLDELMAVMRQIVSSQGLSQVDVSALQHFNRNNHHLFFDLREYVCALTDDQTLLDSFDAALANVVEYQSATPQFLYGLSYWFAVRSHCGFTTYIPQAGFSELNSRYGSTAWYRAICD